MNILIGENIKRLRKEKKITQEALAEIFNVTPAAVSKWENNETYPDITLLFPLSHYFGVSIDDLMGYDYLLIEEEIKNINQEIKTAWYVDNDWEKAKTLSVIARNKYPNNYEIMMNYLFYMTGGQADNDFKVLIDNKEEILKVCDLILEGCNIENYRLEAITYKAKVLYAEGSVEKALDLLNNLPSLYHTQNQKIEQLYPKDTIEFFNQLKSNLDELVCFTGNKFGKYICYNQNISNEEKLKIIKDLYEVYKNIYNNKNLEAISNMIISTIREVKHRNDVIGLNDLEDKEVKNIYNIINNK